MLRGRSPGRSSYALPNPQIHMDGVWISFVIPLAFFFFPFAFSPYVCSSVYSKRLGWSRSQSLQNFSLCLSLIYPFFFPLFFLSLGIGD
jgi:hypothetical protein